MPNIDEAKIIYKAKLVAMHTKPHIPVPNDEKFASLFFQLDVIAGIMLSNSDFFGEANFFMHNFKNVKLYFFYLSKYNREGILGLHVSGDFEHEKLVSKVTDFLQSL
jgi:hypothetical protein